MVTPLFAALQRPFRYVLFLLESGGRISFNVKFDVREDEKLMNWRWVVNRIL